MMKFEVMVITPSLGLVWPVSDRQVSDTILNSIKHLTLNQFCVFLYRLNHLQAY